MKKPIYITTTLPYVNAKPHLGFAMEIIRADILARFFSQQGHDVLFNTGTDEHGQKIYESATKQGMTPQAYVDGIVGDFKNLKTLLNLKEDINFIRTTDAHHIKAAETFWKICNEKGYIYKKDYTIKYCVGCELEKTDSELVDGKCPIHKTIPEQVQEENYFFKLSMFGDKLLKLYEETPDLVIPAFRLEEMKVFVKTGLQDFSISRLASKMPWGVPVPGDAEHVMYVWFDALVNYIAAVGWPDDIDTFNTYWNEAGCIQFCGKDNIRQQSVFWQSMLLAVGIKPSRHIIINGFITAEGGVKMSKSLGNVVGPDEVVSQYSTDVLRYFVAKELHPYEDSPFTWDRLKLAFNAGLANGLGNLTSRVLTMAKNNAVAYEIPELEKSSHYTNLHTEVSALLSSFNIHGGINVIWEAITAADQHIQTTQPFKLIKEDKEKGLAIIKDLVERVYAIASVLSPFMPETSATILKLISEKTVPSSPIFMRK